MKIINRFNWLVLGIIGIAAIGYTLVQLPVKSEKNSEIHNSELTTNNSNLPTPTSTLPKRKRHKINVTITSMDDLKVKEKDRIFEGQIISDRSTDRKRLEAKKQQLNIAIAQLSLPLPELAKLPEPNLAQETIAIKRAEVELDIATKALENQPNKPFIQDWLNEAMDARAVKQESALKERQIRAGIRLEAALARMSEAKTRYQQQKYEHSIQLATHQTYLQKQQFELASLTSQLQEVEKDLGELVAVRSPYSGRVRRVKVLGQNERDISVEVTVDVRG